MQKVIALLSLVILISGCKNNMSSDLSDNEMELEKIELELKLPPEPNESINNSTFKGVDLNNNLIRDDIERKVAIKFYPDMNKIHLLNNAAKANTLMYEAYQNQDLALYKENIDIINKVSSCLIFNEDLSSEDVKLYLVSLHENTSERLETLLRMDIEFSNMETDQEIEAIEMEIEEVECNKVRN